MPFVDRAKAAGVRHIAYMTARGRDGREQSAAQGGAVYREVGRTLHFLRPSWFMQNFSSGFIAPMILGMGGIFLPAADAKTSFIDARDIAAVGIAALTEPDTPARRMPSLAGRHSPTARPPRSSHGPRASRSATSRSRKRISAARWPPRGGSRGRSRCFRTFSAACGRVGRPRSPDVANVLGRPPITLESPERSRRTLAVNQTTGCTSTDRRCAGLQSKARIPPTSWSASCRRHLPGSGRGDSSDLNLIPLLRE